MREKLRPALISITQPLLALFILALLVISLVLAVGVVVHTPIAGRPPTWASITVLPWSLALSVVKDLVYAYVALDDLVNEGHYRFDIAYAQCVMGVRRVRVLGPSGPLSSLQVHVHAIEVMLLSWLGGAAAEMHLM